MNKNEVGKWIVFAYGAPDHATPGLPITGLTDISANIFIDGVSNVVDDAFAEEEEAGYYTFDITATESNGDNLLLSPTSATADVIVIAVPGAVWTRPPNFNDLGIEVDGDLTQVNSLTGHTAQTGDNYTRIGVAGAGLTAIDLPNQTMNIIGDITGSLSGSVGSVNATVNADIVAITGGDAGPADNLELMYNGTGYTDGTAPSSRDQVGTLTSGSAAISVVTNTDLVITIGGLEGNSYLNTKSLDEIVNSLPDSGGSTDAYYEFQVGANGRPVSITWNGYANGNGSTYAIYAYNYGTPGYEQIGSISGSQGSTINEQTFSLTTSHVGTGTDLGKVRFRFSSTDGILFATDRILCSYAVVYQSVGYSLGSLWYDDSVSNTGTVDYVDGVADNPVSTWTAIKALIISTGIKKVQIANGSSVTLDNVSDYFSLIGTGWILALGNQSIDGAYFEGASNVTGIGTAIVDSGLSFSNCMLGSVTIPSGNFSQCGFGVNSGTFTAGSAGQFTFEHGHSMVPGSGSPIFNFSGQLAAVGINNRGYLGGSDYTLDSDCTLSHEVLAGGGTTITTQGGDAEIRGITRSLTVNMNGTEKVQFVGTTGVITLNGTTTAEVNLYGVASSVIDNTITANVTNSTVNATNVNAILEDTETAIPASITALNDFDYQNEEVTADMVKISGSSTAADNLEASAIGIHSTTVTGTPSNTTLNLTSGSGVDDTYNGRVIVMTSGTNAGLAMAITDYSQLTKLCTFDATNTVASGDDLVIV